MKSNNKIALAILGRSAAGAIFFSVACSGIGCLRHPQYRYNPKQLSLQSQSSVVNALRSQHAVGQDLYNTVWNYHFDEFTSDLNQMGRNHLARYVRRNTNCPQQLFLQTAHDVGSFDKKSNKYFAVRQDNIDEFLTQRANLDAKRIETLHEYLIKFYQFTTTDILITDPAPTSIHYEELILSQRTMVRNVEGILPKDTTRSNFLFGGGVGMDYPGGLDDQSGREDPGMSTPPDPSGTDDPPPDYSEEIPSTPSPGSDGTEGMPQP